MEAENSVHVPQIISVDDGVPQLFHSPAPEGQEWSAYTFLLIKEPKQDIYGACKTVCFGRTRIEVENQVKEMLATGKIEPQVPFVRVCRTGMWRYLKAGGDDRDLKEAFDIKSKQAVVETAKAIADKGKEEIRTLKEREKELLAESKSDHKSDPDSFETYAYYRQQFQIASQRKTQLEKELKKINKLREKSTAEKTRLERQFGNYEGRYERMLKGEKE